MSPKKLQWKKVTSSNNSGVGNNKRPVQGMKGPLASHTVHSISDGDSQGSSHGNPSAETVVLDSRTAEVVSLHGAIKDDVLRMPRWGTNPFHPGRSPVRKVEGKSYLLSTTIKTSTGEVVDAPA